MEKYKGVDPKSADIPEAPVQIWDFSGPLAVYSMGMNGLSANRGKRFEQLVEGIFYCPSNKIKSVPWPAPTEDFGTITSVSLHTVRNFMVWPRATQNNYGKAPFDEMYGSSGHTNNHARMRIGGTSNIPDNYSPRISRVGQPSEKVFIADGSRYTEDSGDAPYVDYDPDWDAAYGGAFSTGGPTLNEQYLRAYKFDDPARKFSYRHGKGKTVGIVVGFFDGHAGWMSEDMSRDVSYWYPKGSTIPPNDMNRATIKKYPRTAFDGPGNTYRVPN